MGFSTMIVSPGENGPRGGFGGILTQGDGERYLTIATNGYGTADAALANADLFPLYPFIVWLVSVVFRDAAFTAILVSNLALLGAGILLKELLDREEQGEHVSGAAVTFLMFSPASFIFSGAYAESLLLFLTIGAWLAARMGRWTLAAIAGACAAASHSVGVFVLLPLALEFVTIARHDSQRGSTRVRDGLLLIVGVPLGCAGYLYFTSLRFGDAFAPFRVSTLWGAGFVPPWQAIARTEMIPPFYRTVALLMLFTAAAIWCAGVLLKVRWSYLAYVAFLLGLYSCSTALPSITVWLSIAFPLYIILAVITRRFDWTYEPMLACSFTLLAFCTVLVANGHWLR